MPASGSAPEPTSTAPSGVSAASDLPQPAFGSSVITPLPVRAGSRLTIVDPLPAPGGNTAAEPAVSVEAASSWARPQELAPAAVVPDRTEASAISDTDNPAGLPQPAFGQTALPGPPARVTLAYAGPEHAPALPRPQFGAPALAASAASSAIPPPLTGSGLATRPQAGTPQARTGYADTSSRIGGEAAPNFTYDDELVLQLQSERGEIADTIVAYGTRSGVYLPFSAVTRFLDLAISVSDEGHYASGWFIDESQTVSLNLRSGTLTAGGREFPLGKGDAAAFEGELYLRAERFADLFPLALTVDLRAQAVTVKTRVPFPFEQRISREQQRQQLGAIGRKREQPRWPREPTPWRALSFPLADAELRAVTDQTYGSRIEGDLRLAGDLAFMTARLFAGATTRDGLTGARVELGRRDPDAQLLGPLKATEFQLGDVTTLALPIGLRGTSGRGAFVTNAPLEHASVFDMIDLYGDLPDGYEVELYRNNILIGSTRRPVNGQYQFRKVAVDYGLNVFRMVFYGPQGQRREDVRSISVGDGRLSPGQLVYSFGAAQKDTNLLDVHGPGFTPPLEYGAWRSSALVEYGLTRQLTAALGGAWFDGRFGKRWMATAGLRTGLAGTALKLDLGFQSGGGKAVEFGVGGKLFGLSYALTHAEYRGRFTDELQSFTGDVLRRSTEINVNTTLDLGGDKRPLLFPLYGQFRRVEFADGRKQTDAALRGSVPFAGLLFSNTLNYASNSVPGFGGHSQLIGSFDLATLRGSRLQLRASADYAILPQPSLRGGMLQADYALDERTLVRASVGHTLEDSQTRFGLSAVRRFGQFTLAFDGNYGVPDGSYNAALRLGFSFGRNPLSGQLFFAEPGLTSGGAVAVRAFRDANGNRRFDSGEAVVPEVGFITSSRHGKTDASGLAFIGALGDGSRSSMTIDLETLPDIALAPVSEGIEVIPRAGRVHATDFAIQELSDIEGTAFFTEGAGLGREVSGLVLVLVDAQGKTVARARTEGDGSFYFEQLHPGDYTVAIDKNQAASLKIHLAEAIGLTIGAKSAWLKQVVKVSRD